MVEHTHLFHPAFRALKQQAAIFGQPIAIRSSAGNTGPYRRDVTVLWDWAAHDVAMALDLLPGRVEVIAARSLERSEIEGGTAERVHIRLNLTHDIPCDITVSTLDAKHRWFAADFNDRTLIYSDKGRQPLRLFAHSGAQIDQESISISAAEELPLTVAVREFADAVRHKRPTPGSFSLGCQIVDVLARCEEIMSQ
jgi:predicted dehydrogenase